MHLFLIVLVFITILLLHSIAIAAKLGSSASHHVNTRSWATSSPVTANLPVESVHADKEAEGHREKILKGRIAFTVVASCCILLTAILLGK